MADITYNVLVNLETKGNLTASLGGLNQRIGGLQSAATGVGHVIGGMVEGMRGAFEGVVESVGSVVSSLAKIGAVTAFGAITYGAFKLNRELEDTNMWFAGLFKSQGLANTMSEGMEAGTRLMSQMRKDAASLPGEFSDLKNIMQGSIMAGLNAGLSPAKLEKISAQAMAMTAGQIPSEVVGRELGLMLGGRVTASNTLARMLVGGDRIKELRHMSNDDRVKTITDALQKWNPAIDTMKTSFTAMWTTTIDGAKRFLEVMTKPLFNIGKSFLKEFSFLDENGELGGRARYWAENLGQHLTNAVQWGRAKIEEWFPAIKHFATEAFYELKNIWIQIAPIVEGLTSKIKNMMESGSIIEKIEQLLKLYAASKVVGGFQSLIPSGGSLFSLANLAFGGGGGIGAAGIGGMAAVGGTAALLGGAAIAGAIDNVTNSASVYHEMTVNELAIMTEASKSLTFAFDLAREQADGLGVVLTTVGAGISLVLPLFAGIGKAFHDIINDVGQGIGNLIKEFTGPIDLVGRAHHEIRDKELHRKVDAVKNDVLNKTVPGAGGGGGGVHVDKVEINISSNQDPSRIARMTISHLAELKKRTKISPYATNFSAVTK